MVDVATPVHTPVSESGECSGITNPMRSISIADINTNNVEVVTLQRTIEGFGLHIVGGTNSQHFPGENGIFISQIKYGGPADKSKKLSPGDEILSINNEIVSGKTHDDVVRMFADCKDYVTLIVDHCGEKRILKGDPHATFMGNITGSLASNFLGSGHMSSVESPRTDTPAVNAKEEEMEPSVDDNTPALPIALPLNKNKLHALSSFETLKADADSTSSWFPSTIEQDDDSMSTITEASTHFYVDDVPPTPHRPYSLLDGDSPYDGVIYGCVGAGVILLVGYLVARRLMRRGAQ